MVEKTTKKPPKKNRKHMKVISAFAVLFGIIGVMAVLTWVIPSGRYKLVADPHNPGAKIRQAGSYREIEKYPGAYHKDEVEEPEQEYETENEAEHEDYDADTDDDAEDYGEFDAAEELDEESEAEAPLPATKDHRQGLWDVLLAPIKGMSERLDVIVFILILGGFLGIVMKTGALDASLGGLLKKMRGKEKWLIPTLMTLFAVGGTTYGMQEEAVAFYALIIPVMLAAGYNAMTAVMMIVLGGGVGVLASTINPFSTGIAAHTADVPLGNILWIQGIVLVLMLIVAIVFTMRYAAKVKAGKYQEDAAVNTTFKSLDVNSVPEYNFKRKLIMLIFGATFLVMIASLVPWTDFNVTIFEQFHEWVGTTPVGAVLGIDHAEPLGKWYFNEISALFFASALLIAWIYRKDFQETGTSITDTFINGSEQLLSVAVIIAVAAAVSVVMRAGAIEDTIIHWGEQALHNNNGGLVGILGYLFYLPLSFIIPSSSGLAAASMPIIAPVAELTGSSKETMVVAFANANGLLNMLAPTIASLMAGLTIAGVSYKNWLKRVLPVMIVFMLISLAAVYLMGGKV